MTPSLSPNRARPWLAALAITFTLVTSLNFANATTSILHTTFDSPNFPVPIVDASGTDLAVGTGGTVAMGYFMVADAVIAALHGNLTGTAIMTLMASFVAFGDQDGVDGVNTHSIGDPTNGFASTFDATLSDLLTDSDGDTGNATWVNTFADPDQVTNSNLGRFIYTVVGDVNTGGEGSLADLANSSSLLVYKHNSRFARESPTGGPAAVNLTVDFGASNGTLLLGNVFADTGFTSTFGGFTPAQQAVSLETIPEPSRALLSLVALCGCALRRRR